MDTKCTYRGNRDEMIVAYLYDAIESGDRADFEAHIAGCIACRLELSELGAVRAQLAAWAPPEPAAGWVASRGAYGGTQKIGRGWTARIGEMPAWAQVAAAMVLLGVAAGAANLDVSYDQSGLAVRTGWMRSGATSQPISVQAGRETPVAAALESAPWRADLAALERQLRGDLQSSRPASQTDAAETSIMRRVRALIDESEKRQQRELALSVAEVASETRMQRVQDLRNIDRNLTAIQSNTAGDLVRLYNMTNAVATKVSQVR